MLLIETDSNEIPAILGGDRPIALVPAASPDRAKKIAIAARVGGFGVSVIENRSQEFFVLVVGEQDRKSDLQRFVRPFGADVAIDRHIDFEKVYCPARWLAGMAHTHRADKRACMDHTGHLRSPRRNANGQFAPQRDLPGIVVVRHPA